MSKAAKDGYTFPDSLGAKWLSQSDNKIVPALAGAIAEANACK
jgi:hypothetical protein